MTGAVKWFRREKGYGFIIGEDGKEVFVHHTNINMKGFRTDINLYRLRCRLVISEIQRTGENSRFHVKIKV